MDIAYCGACQHVGALHAGGGTGHCRLNGCPCSKFAETPAYAGGGTMTGAQDATLERGEIVLPGVSTETFTAILTAIAFLAGLLVGAFLGFNL